MRDPARGRRSLRAQGLSRACVLVHTTSSCRQGWAPDGTCLHNQSVLASFWVSGPVHSGEPLLPGTGCHCVGFHPLPWPCLSVFVSIVPTSVSWLSPLAMGPGQLPCPTQACFFVC